MKVLKISGLEYFCHVLSLMDLSSSSWTMITMVKTSSVLF